jgi:uroporphyrinogen decarboxylase
MTDKQWNELNKIISGDYQKPAAGFIIDSPWLPNWYGIDILDYFSNDELWFAANKKAHETFPDIMFFPGFWSEVGMCSEPSAFGARCSFPKNEFPHVYKSIHSIEDINRIQKPNPATDGFGPFLLNRLRMYRTKIEDTGHSIRFSVTRGPLNIASYLMGTTEFLTYMMMEPEKIHKLLGLITEYLLEWHELQRNTFPSIDGILILDDIIGFVGETEFKEFVLPCLRQLYSPDVSVKFLHNDAECGVSLKYLPEIGINLFNMGFDRSLNELKRETEKKVVMLGNIPPRDVLASGTPQEVKEGVISLKNNLEDPSNVIYSCGGGMPPGVTTENILAFMKGVMG